jgi:crotonobetainyl-CoA:carnitine CoA-transferase CaiB-like acyl-CoA transferase
MMRGVLEGIRVLDFGRYIAGPYCATLLADYGAEVIRIERVDGGEDRHVTPVGGSGQGALFLQCARNKRGLTLNPMKPEGRQIVRKLAASADVVVANLPGKTLESMGLDYASLCAVKPDIILTHITAYGAGGPYSERVGFDAIGQAMSGNMHLGGDPDTPMKSAVPYVDFTTAILHAFGTVMAILERRQSGTGQVVSGSLLASALTVSNAYLVEQALDAPNRVSSGNRSQIAGPSDAFQTRDGWIMTQVIGEPLFRRWAELVGAEEWLTDPRFADDPKRGEHGTLLSERMQAWCSERTTAEAIAELEAARIPAGPVYSPQQALDDPHIQAAGFLQNVPFPGLHSPAPIAATPVQLSRTPAEIRHRAPGLGEHTDEILAEIGYGADEIAGFRERRVV